MCDCIEFTELVIFVHSLPQIFCQFFFVFKTIEITNFLQPPVEVLHTYTNICRTFTLLLILFNCSPTGYSDWLVLVQINHIFDSPYFRSFDDVKLFSPLFCAFLLFPNATNQKSSPYKGFVTK